MFCAIAAARRNLPLNTQHGTPAGILWQKPTFPLARLALALVVTLWL